MTTQPAASVAEITHRGLRLQARALVFPLTLVLLGTASARTNHYSALLVFICGVALVVEGYGFRIGGRLLQIVDPPSPRWVSRAATATLVAGPVIAAFGLWLFFHFRHVDP